jgi:hypothetical protein
MSHAISTTITRRDNAEWLTWRGCVSKRTYQTRKVARRTQKRLMRLYKVKYAIYRCPKCTYYHLGHQNPKYSAESMIREMESVEGGFGIEESEPAHLG